MDGQWDTVKVRGSGTEQQRDGAAPDFVKDFILFGSREYLLVRWKKLRYQCPRFETSAKVRVFLSSWFSSLRGGTKTGTSSGNVFAS